MWPPLHSFLTWMWGGQLSPIYDRNKKFNYEFPDRIFEDTPMQDASKGE